MVSNRSAPTATVVPVLIYEDVGEAINWLCRAFGFTERLRHAGRDGTVSHAQLAIAEGAIMLGRQGDTFRPPRPGEVSQYAKQFGARIVKPLTNMPFGERLYTAEDHAGHRWTFSQHVADVAPEAWGATPARPR